ncbi:hypothetical protein GCK72_000138 [Caenorhabditis remanei]|uniref:Glycine cleavage system H protein n=1 Tax=Caenorhabditis remanei TaxID=31234 RepID=A0A6A5HNT1_CAERE|nr:hypothetical protein GCK72_000138 [Caenorhabditis remanei]KAF1768326.1 hypothetical protein GCK72_000138 [Caenorhabditis remanei]
MSLLRRSAPSLRSAVRFASSGRLYTKKHEWVVVENGVGTVGITDFATEQLGDVVFIELPDEGTEISKGDSTGAVESVKAASDIYAPISGTVTQKNVKLEEEAGLINKSPFEKGWLYKLKVKSEDELKKLLTEQQYEQFKKDEEAAH